MVILDLYAEVSPIWSETESFYGKPFIWCMLHNFGGNLGLYGMIPTVTNNIPAARANSTMVGVGITMEVCLTNNNCKNKHSCLIVSLAPPFLLSPQGINQNYVVYDLALEMGWREEPVNTSAWIRDFAVRRYGSV